MARLLSYFNPIITSIRCVRVARYIRPYLRDLYHRRLLQGPEKYRPRSAWPPWDYDAEIMAFNSRIGENLSTDLLRLCFTDKSYSIYSKVKGTDDSLQDNSSLAGVGRSISEEYIKGFLRKFYPRLPEEWVVCIQERLLSDTELALVGAHLGITDIVLYAPDINPSDDSPLSPEITEPPALSVIAKSFLAVIGALGNHKQAAELFVRDFILTRLVELDLCADFEFPMLDSPFALLEGVLRRQKRGPPEARLQRQSSMNTLLACYQVGIYSDKQLVGEAPGETLEVAEKEAAIQSLRNLFGINDGSPPLPLSGPLITVDDVPPNPSLEEYLKTPSD